MPKLHMQHVAGAIKGSATSITTLLFRFLQGLSLWGGRFLRRNRGRLFFRGRPAVDRVHLALSILGAELDPVTRKTLRWLQQGMDAPKDLDAGICNCS